MTPISYDGMRGAVHFLQETVPGLLMRAIPGEQGWALVCSDGEMIDCWERFRALADVVMCEQWERVA